MEVPLVQMDFTLDSTIRCASSRPGPHVGFAIGAAGQWDIINAADSAMISEGSNRWWKPGRDVIKPKRASLGEILLEETDDILAVDWLNHDTVFGGTRSGKVLLADLREPDGEIVQKIVAHRGIQRVRTIDSNRLVVAALGNKVCERNTAEHLLLSLAACKQPSKC